ncbi:MAG: YceI family protein [Candidatus Binatia bacterium]
MRRADRFAVAAVLSLFLAPVAGASTWDLDPAHTAVQFAVRHLMVSTVRGDFTKVTGTVKVDDADWTKSVIEATIQAESLNTRVAKRDEHLRGPDFFDVAKFPVITFKSKKIEKAGEGKFKVTGDLTLRGTTKEVVLDVDGPVTPRKDMQGTMRSGAQATAKVNRKDFGIVWNKMLDGGGLALGDEVSVTIDVEATRTAE